MKPYVHLSADERLQVYQFFRDGLSQAEMARRTFIDARPSEANERTETGHWESDSLLFGREQAVNVLVDRLSRFTVLTRLAGKTAQDTRTVLVERLDRLPHRSLTADNGSENAEHGSIWEHLAIPFFFCHPYHSWEKGTVENTNGLIRRYLPRDTDLRRVGPDDLEAIASELNHRPRKCLGFLTPAEVLSGHSVAPRD